jgi:hypothetical protein
MIASIVRGILVSLGVQAGLEAINKSKGSGYTVPGGAFYIEYADNWVKCRTGTVRSVVLADIKQLLDPLELKKATIIRSASGKYTFSGNIPEGARQRIINIVSNS